MRRDARVVVALVFLAAADVVVLVVNALLWGACLVSSVVRLNLLGVEIKLEPKCIALHAVQLSVGPQPVKIWCIFPLQCCSNIVHT